MLRVVALTLLVGCGRVAFDPLTGDSGALEDAADVAVLGPFGTPTPLTTISSASEDDPTLTSDGLEIVFESGRGGGCGGADLYWSQRQTTSDPFAPPVLLTALCSAFDDEHPGLSGDGLTIYFGSNRGGGPGGHDIWVSERTSRGSTAWSAPVLTNDLNSPTADEAAQPSFDHLTMVLASGQDGIDENLVIASRAVVNTMWSMPVAVVGVDVVSSETDSGPALSADKLVLYYSSNRTPPLHHIYRSTRSSETAPFGPSEMLTELAIAGGEADPWVSPDQRRIVYAASNGQLYEALR